MKKASLVYQERKPLLVDSNRKNKANGSGPTIIEIVLWVHNITCDLKNEMMSNKCFNFDFI